MSRDQIVDEALGLFADRGFERVTVRALGARVGLHNSSLFHHFGGKGEIVQGVLDRLRELGVDSVVEMDGKQERIAFKLPEALEPGRLEQV